MKDDGKANSGDAAHVGGSTSEFSSVILGPTNAGKTTLLLAIRQACLTAGNDEFLLDFVPEDENTVALLRAASDFLFRGVTVQASRGITRYPFRIFVRERDSAFASEFSSFMSVTDGPGGYLFPQSSQALGAADAPSLRDVAQSANCLVLCIDASNPSLEVLHSALPLLLYHLKGGSRRLPHLRVLLLLTKFDRLVARYIASRRPSTRSSLNTLAEPNGLMRVISSLGQAELQLGSIVGMLQSSLDEKCLFAVSVCSAFGMRPAQRRALGGVSSNDHANSVAVEDLSAWTPYGVREAILFLAAGVIRHPVQRVPHDGVASVFSVVSH